MAAGNEGRPRPGAQDPESKQAPLARRLGWFVLLWLAGVASVSALAYLLRLVIHA